MPTGQKPPRWVGPFLLSKHELHAAQWTAMHRNRFVQLCRALRHDCDIDNKKGDQPLS
jgi:hypothetical protein